MHKVTFSVNLLLAGLLGGSLAGVVDDGACCAELLLLLLLMLLLPAELAKHSVVAEGTTLNTTILSIGV